MLGSSLIATALKYLNKLTENMWTTNIKSSIFHDMHVVSYVAIFKVLQNLKKFL